MLKHLICNIVITEASKELRSRFKSLCARCGMTYRDMLDYMVALCERLESLCAREGKTYRDMLDELITFYEQNKR